MSKNNQIDYIEFPAKSVEELNKTRDFFSSVFGWKYAMYGDDYADTSESGVFSGINAEGPTQNILAIIYVDNLAKAYDKVKAAGGDITKEIFSFPGGQRFHFKDPAGNELAAWSK